MNIAENIFTKVGGVGVAHKALLLRYPSIDLSTLYKWRYPVERQGTGGRIPVKYHQDFLDLFDNLAPKDFFMKEDDGALGDGGNSATPS